MSGYLLRMAASARNPVGSIHPMLGSVMSPSPFHSGGEELPGPDLGMAASARRPDESIHAKPGPRPAPSPFHPGSEEFPGQETELTPDQPISGFAPPPDVAMAEPEEAAGPRISRRASYPSEVRSLTGSELTWDKADAGPAPLERSSFQPLLNTTQKGDAETRFVPPPGVYPEAVEFRQSAPAGTRAPVTPDESPNADQVSADAELPETLVREAEQRNVPHVVDRNRYQPLMAEMTPRIDEAAARPFAAGVRKAEKTNWSGREATPEREPDEIQIHIGRIEVMAVPPAPARAETKPVNRSPNLGDYLKLRHGR